MTSKRLAMALFALSCLSKMAVLLTSSLVIWLFWRLAVEALVVWMRMLLVLGAELGFLPVGSPLVLVLKIKLLVLVLVLVLPFVFPLILLVVETGIWMLDPVLLGTLMVPEVDGLLLPFWLEGVKPEPEVVVVVVVLEVFPEVDWTPRVPRMLLSLLALASPVEGVPELLFELLEEEVVEVVVVVDPEELTPSRALSRAALVIEDELVELPPLRIPPLRPEPCPMVITTIWEAVFPVASLASIRIG